MTARPARLATDALLIGVALLLVLAVATDLGRRAGLSQRMRIDRHALRIYMGPRAVDPHLMRISVHGTQDLVCAPAQDRPSRRARVCLRVTHAASPG